MVRGDGHREEPRLIKKVYGVYLGAYLRPSSSLLQTSVVGGRAVDIRERMEIWVLTRLRARQQIQNSYTDGPSITGPMW